ncbi:hypothetical protein [Plantibacter sp. M259]|uniref:hypothetical protein n=1 Tax=Plantibacter sp. M259 TaxID=2583822 RepID=UPI002104BC0A|nr:hypothetical protein [Plantibacter sp. M259]
MKMRAQSTLAATFINFIVGTLVLVIAAVLHAVIVAPPGPLPGSGGSTSAARSAACSSLWQRSSCSTRACSSSGSARWPVRP